MHFYKMSLFNEHESRNNYNDGRYFIKLHLDTVDSFNQIYIII